MFYEYAIYPHKGNWEEAGLYSQVESFNSALKLIQTGKHGEGSLPLEQSFYSVEPENLIMSAFKKAEDRDSFIMRLFNLNEEKIESVEIRDNHSININAGSNKILTVEFVF